MELFFSVCRVDFLDAEEPTRAEIKVFEREHDWREYMRAVGHGAFDDANVGVSLTGGFSALIKDAKRVDVRGVSLHDGNAGEFTLYPV